MTAKGQQRYRCRACGRPHRENPGSNAYSAAKRGTILRAYAERSSLRGLSRTLWRVAQHGDRLAEKKP